MHDQAIKSEINKLWNKFWAGGITNPLTAIEQISYLIFMKRLEELDERHKSQSEATGNKYTSIFKDHEDYKWSQWRHLPAEEMLSFVRDEVFPFIKEIKIGEDALFAENMKHAAFIIPKPSLLQEATGILDKLFETTKASNKDTLGDIYEYLLSEIQTSGKNGQFRTPRHIIRMMVKLLHPSLGETVCDPACGTAGFLTLAYEHILEQNTPKEMIEYDEEGNPHNLTGAKIGTKKTAWEHLKRKTFYGNDSDDTMVRLSIMNMILHGIEHPNISRNDSLSKAYDQTKKFDVILANPPFTGTIDKSDIHENFKIQTTKTELLYLELFYNLLDVGGRAAVIVPNGVLFGSSKAHKEIRKILLEKCRLDAVISMPSGVFKPYSGVGTAVLVFTKGEKTKDIWFYDMKSDGFSLDDKRTFVDGQGDIPEIIEKFKSKEESENSVLVPLSKIKEEYNLSFSRYKEAEYKEIEYEPPKKIIEKTLKLEKEITEELEELKKMI